MAEEEVPNQGATGTRPLGETPLTVETESDPTQATTPQQVVEPEGGPDSPPRGESPLDGQSHAEHSAFSEHPEYFVGAAFAGGLAAALILRVLGPSE